MSLMQIVLVAMRSLKHRNPLALLPLHSNQIQRDLWVSVSFDHVCIAQQSQEITFDCFTQAGGEPEEYDEDRDFE